MFLLILFLCIFLKVVCNQEETSQTIKTTSGWCFQIQRLHYSTRDNKGWKSLRLFLQLKANVIISPNLLCFIRDEIAQLVTFLVPFKLSTTQKSI